MSRVAVSKKILDWALSRSGVTVADLERRFPKASQWATGETQPTLRQLETLAKLTTTPFGFFFLEEPPEERLPVPYFRTLADDVPATPSPDLLETIQMMQLRQAWMREYLVEQGQEPLPFVRSARLDESPASIAEPMRQILDFDEEWASKRPTWTDALRTLREGMEEAGILVVVNGVVGNNTHRTLDPVEFRGFVLVDEYAPLAFVNGADGKAAQMFTLAHEMAHVFFGSSAVFDLREMQPANDPTERACDRVAAEFLVPGNQLSRVWNSVRHRPERFQAIARRFKVSEIVAARRALDLGLVRKETFLEFYREYRSRERHAAARRPEGGDFYANQNLRVGQRFASAVIRAVKEGKVLYSEAYRLTGLSGTSFERYATSLGVGGA